MVHEIAAEAARVGRPRIKLPMGLLRAGARVNDAASPVLRRDLKFAGVGMRMVELMGALDHGKAERELGWTPQPVEESIRSAVKFFQAQHA